jgi:hypothetical protein
MIDNTRYIKTVTETNNFSEPADGYNHYDTVYKALEKKHGSIANAPDDEVNQLSDNILDFFIKINHPAVEYFKSFKYDKRGRLGVMYHGTGPGNTGGISQGPIWNYHNEHPPAGMFYRNRKSKRYKKSKRNKKKRTKRRRY